MLSLKQSMHTKTLFFMKNIKHSFWMKNCIVHLDIIYINENKIVKPNIIVNSFRNKNKIKELNNDKKIISLKRTT